MNDISVNENILIQLKIHFDNLSDNILIKVCKHFSWNLENCLQYLVHTNMNNTMNEMETLADVITKQLSNGSLTSKNVITNSNKLQSDKHPSIYDKIKSGFRILILMRGAPGSGKSYLAEELIRKTMNLEEYQLTDFIFSTDNFFMDSKGTYNFHYDSLSSAHIGNQRRVDEYASIGWSPIIVDNTNMQIWEMMPYVEMAVRNGYIVEILEASTPWCKAPGKLAQRTLHNVPRDKIANMLERYEYTTAENLIKNLKQTSYQVTLPQMRILPPYITESQTDEINENDDTSNIVEKSQRQELWSSYDTADKPKNQRKTTTQKINPWHILNNDATPKLTDLNLNEMGATAVVPENKKTLLDLLREGANDIVEKNMQKEPADDTILSNLPIFTRHSVDCPNENGAFAMLRQIYSNKQVSSLWDLFVKCNGDTDWAIDLLLKEDDLKLNQNADFIIESEENFNDNFICTCNGSQPIATIQNAISLDATTAQLDNLKILPDFKPQRHRQNQQRSALNEKQNAVKQSIERSVVISNEYYSDFVRNVRDIRHGNIQTNENNNEVNDVHENGIQNETEPIQEQVEGDQEEQNEFIELNLGDDLIKQLNNIYKDELLISECVHDDAGVKNIFIPRTLGKELFMSWIESNYNHIEEQRRLNAKDDEEFAQLLANPKYSHFEETPNNVRELLDMEMAWSIYKNDEMEIKEAMEQQSYERHDLATYLTQRKLFEKFPTIPRHVLLDILAAHSFCYSETVNVLNKTLKYEQKNDGAPLTAANLIERAIKENEIETQKTVNHSNRQPANTGTPQNNYDYFSFGRTTFNTHESDEAKKVALRDFEDTRNLAAYHCQLKAECFLKAKNAIQRGNTGVAVYYSQIANLHKKKIDMYNHRAANCIIEVHQYTQKNPDLLDLHYLHAMEALNCLDIFLDRHIHELRAKVRPYKNIFIITGRGLHSAGGISTIKNRVRHRLQDRSLRWTEVNPGLLKVKIFSTSRYAINQ